jgi:hypothetical protein
VDGPGKPPSEPEREADQQDESDGA